MAVLRNPDNSQVVSQRNLTLGQAKFLRTDDGTALLNINGLAAGSPTVLWNGTGALDTGGDWTQGNQGTESAAAMHSGTNGLDSGSTSQGNNTQFDNGVDLDVAGTYDTLEFWMQPKAYPAGSELQLLWKTSGGTTKGNVLNVSDYVTNFDLDVWQKVTVPISDFALPQDVARLQFKYANKSGQQFYLDDIQFNNSGGGGPFVFQVVAPDTTKQYHLSMLVILLSGAASGWNSTTFANVAALENGLLLRQRKISTGEVLWSLNSKDNLDLFGRFYPQDEVNFADGTLLVGFMVKPGNGSVIITNDTALEIVVRDDLSGIAAGRAFAHFGIESLVV